MLRILLSQHSEETDITSFSMCKYLPDLGCPCAVFSDEPQCCVPTRLGCTQSLPEKINCLLQNITVLDKTCDSFLNSSQKISLTGFAGILLECIDLGMKVNELSISVITRKMYKSTILFSFFFDIFPFLPQCFCYFSSIFILELLSHISSTV